MINTVQAARPQRGVARLLLPCIGSSAMAVLLLTGRNLLGAGGYHFLLWNLFLAWLPYLAALVLAWPARRGKLWFVAAAPVATLWLLFLPNAPYIATDLIHLPDMGFVWWYDIATLLAFVWAGCLLGAASLDLVRGVVQRLFGPLASWIVLIGAAGLSGVGVYMGRFLRWNSWDALLRPRSLARETLAILSEPANYPRLIGVSLIIMLMMLLLHLTLSSARLTLWEEDVV